MSSSARSRALLAITAAIALTFTTALVGAPASAAVGGTISGTVTGQSGPSDYDPLQGVEVMFFSTTGSGVPYVTTTDSDGEYSIGGLEQGVYHVFFSPSDPASPHRAEWFQDSAYESISSGIILGASNVEDFDNALGYGGTISGTISSESATDRGAAAAFLFDFSTGEWERYSRWANADANGNYTIRGLNDGTYLLRFAGQGDNLLLSTEYWDDETYWSNSEEVTITGQANLTGYNADLVEEGINLVRVFGPNRYATGVAASYGAWGEGPIEAAFIVNGKDFPDALSAGPAAAHIAAPLLLTTPDTLAPVVASRLNELQPDFIFIIGGTPSVSSVVESQLQAYANNDVIRISGPNRYATSRLVADYFFNSADTAYIATGANFPDALSAGPAAANEHGPVILVPGATSSAGVETVGLLEDLGVSKIVIAGGEPSVSAAIESELRSTPYVTHVYRRAGVNRYDTALKIAQGSFPMSDGVFFATGVGFPDALAGAALAGHPAWRNPILLVRTNCVPAGINEEIARLKPSDIYLLGGEPSIGNAVAAGVPC